MSSGDNRMFATGVPDWLPLLLNLVARWTWVKTFGWSGYSHLHNGQLVTRGTVICAMLSIVAPPSGRPLKLLKQGDIGRQFPPRFSTASRTLWGKAVLWGWHPITLYLGIFNLTLVPPCAADGILFKGGIFNLLCFVLVQGFMTENGRLSTSEVRLAYDNLGYVRLGIDPQVAKSGITQERDRKSMPQKGLIILGPFKKCRLNFRWHFYQLKRKLAFFFSFRSDATENAAEFSETRLKRS